MVSTQESTRRESSEEAEDLSPMPASTEPPVKTRRGAFSSEPISEDDVVSYVKKVRLILIPLIMT